jgi:hypothetical protein
MFLLTLLNTQQQAITGAVQQCMSSPTLVLSAPLLQEVPFSETNAYESSGLPRERTLPVDVPLFVVPRRAWGLSRLETLDTLIVVVITLIGLTVGCAAACALAFARMHRRSVIRDIFGILGAGRRRAHRTVASFPPAKPASVHAIIQAAGKQEQSKSHNSESKGRDASSPRGREARHNRGAEP